MTTTKKKADRLRISLRWLWLGPTVGIICMIALFVYGLTSKTTQLLIISSTTAVVLAVIWASTYVALRAQLARLES